MLSVETVFCLNTVLWQFFVYSFCDSDVLVNDQDINPLI